VLSPSPVQVQRLASSNMASLKLWQQFHASNQTVDFKHPKPTLMLVLLSACWCRSIMHRAFLQCL
jgi:hypothetical protein